MFLWLFLEVLFFFSYLVFRSFIIFFNFLIFLKAHQINGSIRGSLKCGLSKFHSDFAIQKIKQPHMQQ